MIHRITIENFFSIADKQEIKLEVPLYAPDLPCFQSPHSDPDGRLPMVVGFFGPNASGKTTVLRSLSAVVAFVKHSLNLDIEGFIPFFRPYLRKDWVFKPTKIVIDFDARLDKGLSSYLFRYELHISHFEKRDEVIHESLSYFPKGKIKRLFERKQQDVKFGQEFEIKDNDPRVQAIRPNASVLSTLAQLNHRLSMNFISSLNTVQTNIVGLDKLQPNAKEMLSYYAQYPDCLNALNRELRRLDVGLLEMMLPEQDSQGKWFAKFKHIGLDAPLYIDEESGGTKRFIELFPGLYYAFITGGIAVIDEIDSDLHPLLLPELFRWFSDPERNQNKAQLFFTAHNPSLLDALEKEQVFFTQKPSGKPTEVFRASDIKGLRREPSLMNKYLGGELGAIPYIG